MAEEIETEQALNLATKLDIRLKELLTISEKLLDQLKEQEDP